MQNQLLTQGNKNAGQGKNNTLSYAHYIILITANSVNTELQYNYAGKNGAGRECAMVGKQNSEALH